MTKTAFGPLQLSLIGFTAILLLAWMCYRPALGGAFQLDDVSNLSGLAAIEDSASAGQYILSGTAGPTGRPLTLLTFAMQANKWEQGAEAFLRVNVLIHLVNAALLAACFFQLSLLRSVDRGRAAIIAVVAAGCWVLMPVLATASLLVVQRMATLSASFILLGLLGYLLARSSITDAPRKALTGMSTSLVLGTVLATLAKESGALLPLFVLVLEATVLSRPNSMDRRHWRAWQAVFLVLPTLLVVAYLLTRIPYPDWLVAARGFTVVERLITESQILWVYVQKSILGVPAKLGIYQAAPPLSRSLLEPMALLSVVSWLALFVLSIAWRRRYPLAALAVLWFLGGHLLESTVLPLELYFEHRNYLPVAGPLYALTAWLVLGPVSRQKVLAVLAPLFIVINGFFLYSFASLSGEPSTTSRYWALQYPDSVRAVSTMATYQLAEEGPVRALTTIDQFVIRKPQYAYLRIQELNIRCLAMPQRDHTAVIEELRQQLPAVDFTYTAGTMLSQLFSTAVASDCNGVDTDLVRQLASLLRDNPRYAGAPLYNQFHHKLLAGISRQEGDFEGTIDELEEAISYSGSAELNMMMVTALAGAGDFDGARTFIANARDNVPMNPLKGFAWRRDLRNLGEYVDELERYSESAN